MVKNYLQIKRKILATIIDQQGEDWSTPAKANMSKLCLSVGKNCVKDFNVSTEDKQVMYDVFDELIEVCNSKMN